MNKAALLLLVATSTAVAAVAPGPDKLHLKPGAKGKVCLTCHPTFEDTLKLPSVHTPVKAGECSDCHDPHTSNHGKLLAEEPNKICFQCHANMAPAKARSVHQAVAEGACVKCHDPHGSKYKNNLVAAGADLCLGCHKDIAASIGDAKFKHSPVDQGCLGCHDPHASVQAASLLKKTAPGLCADCHRADQPAFVKQHMGYPVAKADCTSCHDPHGSSSKGMLWASVHGPVANRMCTQCHQDPGSPDALKTKKAGFELCRGCHSDTVNETFAKNWIHWPVVDRLGCTNCHSPHAAKEKGLLLASQKNLCGGCHAEAVARQAKSVTKHKPVEDGSCTACHAPHSSNGVYLLSNPSVVEVCGACHDWQKHSTHPIGEKVRDPRNKNLSVDCLSCHRAHGTPYKYLSYFDAKMDLCVQCHTEMKR